MLTTLVILDVSSVAPCEKSSVIEPPWLLAGMKPIEILLEDISQHIYDEDGISLSIRRHSFIEHPDAIFVHLLEW